MLFVIIALLVIAVIFLTKIFVELKDISESLRLLANNPKTLKEAKKVRLQTYKSKDVTS